MSQIHLPFHLTWLAGRNILSASTEGAVAVKIPIKLGTFASAAVLLSTMVTSNGALALPKDGNNPNGCSSPQSVRVESIRKNGVTIGIAQLRFSDPCDIVWGRVCYTPGSAPYSLFYTEGHRTIPSNDQYLWQSAAYTSSGSGVCTGYAYTSAGWTVGVEDDCMEDYGYSCKAHTMGALADNAGTYWSAQTSDF